MLLAVAHFADKLDPRIPQQRADHVFEIGHVDLVDLGCDLELHACARGDLDRPVRALFRADPTEERQISIGALRRERVKVRRQAVRNGRDPTRR